MGTTDWEPRRLRRFLFSILRMLAVNHSQQRSLMDDVTLGNALQRMLIEFSVEDLITTLQDMQDRGWIDFRLDRMTYRKMATDIRLLPAGRDLFEGNSDSPAIDRW
jgi:hypothetical protein